jgi:hypothetical protein
MAQRCEVFVHNSYWVCPAGVSAIFINAIAPGGGGSEQTGLQAAKGAGGSGEFVMNWWMPVTPGVEYFIDIGISGKGARARASVTVSDSVDGGTLIFNNFSLLGGKRSPSGAGSTHGGSGGGPNSGIESPGFIATAGVAESIVHFGGAAGGPGGGFGGGRTGGQVIGQHLSSSGYDGINASGGSAGGNTPWSTGGAGGDGYDIANSQPGSGKGGLMGGGGGGASQDTGTGPDPADGGDGSSGMLQLFYFTNN